MVTFWKMKNPTVRISTKIFVVLKNDGRINCSWGGSYCLGFGDYQSINIRYTCAYKLKKSGIKEMDEARNERLFVGSSINE